MRKFRIAVLGAVTGLLLFSMDSQAKDESCECPKLACDPCSVNQGVTFFTEKCGPNNSKVKSCARPTCIPVDRATAECPNPPAAGSGPREPIVVTDVGQMDAADDRSATAVGRVKVIKGSVSIVSADGKKSVIQKEASLRETDTIAAGADGSALVGFDGGNKMHVHPGTEVKVKEFKNPNESASRKVLLNLIKGRIRNQVEQKYNGKTSYFKVETKAAVAGVRGTDFVIEQNLGDVIETRVETLDGKVVFGGKSGDKSHVLERGEGATFTIPKAADSATSEFFANGTLSPIYKIPAERLRELEIDSRVDVARASKVGPARPAEKEICDNPKGFLDQCSWQRVGEACVRRRCNANGVWAEETKLPSSSMSLCPAKGFTVKECDY